MSPSTLVKKWKHRSLALLIIQTSHRYESTGGVLLDTLGELLIYSLQHFFFVFSIPGFHFAVPDCPLANVKVNKDSGCYLISASVQFVFLYPHVSRFAATCVSSERLRQDLASLLTEKCCLTARVTHLCWSPQMCTQCVVTTCVVSVLLVVSIT